MKVCGFNQVKLLENGLNLDQAVLIEQILEHFKVEHFMNEFYYICPKVLANELPILNKKQDTISRDLKIIKSVGIFKAIEVEELVELLKLSHVLSTGFFKCEWCQSKTFNIHEHHYPISKADGGSEVVKICADCHYKFHSNKFYRLNKNTLNELI